MAVTIPGSDSEGVQLQAMVTQLQALYNTAVSSGLATTQRIHEDLSSAQRHLINYLMVNADARTPPHFGTARTFLQPATILSSLAANT